MNEQRHWLVGPRTIRILWIVFAAILAVTLIPNLFVHPHARFGIDGGFGFYAWYGFIVCVAQILISKFLAIFLKRPDSYYDE
jgi:uncharacterized membrane protein